MRGIWFTGIAVLFLTGSSHLLAQRQGSGGMVPAVPLPSSPSRTTGYPPIGGMPMDPSASPDILLNPRIAEQQARTRNSERQKRLESDTQKLVGLVDELKQQIQSEKEMSPSELSKRAEEIEKLARSVKDKMRG
ncbi:MAG TPA: hypothetical protein VHN81_00815 [Edaphobacter sp.]|nr:hypothetical protein [Edaphobacter sp.]